MTHCLVASVDPLRRLVCEILAAASAAAAPHSDDGGGRELTQRPHGERRGGALAAREPAPRDTAAPARVQHGAEDAEQIDQRVGAIRGRLAAAADAAVAALLQNLKQPSARRGKQRRRNRIIMVIRQQTM